MTDRSDLSVAAIPPRIRLRAARWAVRLRDPSTSDRDRAALARWLARDRRHQVAFEALAATSDLAAALRAEMRVDTRPAAYAAQRPAFARRAAFAGIACCIAGAAGWFLLSLPDSYQTGVGELRSVRLDDGTMLHLNAATRVEVRLRKDRRALTLVAGEALFEVAKDPARPFQVTAGPRVIEAIGTAFDIDRAGGDVAVAVREGVVALRPSADGAPTARLAEGDAIQVDADGTQRPVQRVAATEIGAWRQGILQVRDASFATMVAALARNFPGTYRVDDPALAATRVSIALRLETRDATLQMIEKLFDVRAVRDNKDTIRFVRARRL